MRELQPLPKLVSFIAPLLGLALWIGCTSTTNLPGSDASWSAAGGTKGRAGAGGGVAGTGGSGGGGTGGHTTATLDAGIDRRPSASDAGLDRPVASDAQSCSDGGSFICTVCSSDDVFESAMCGQGVWACRAPLTPVGSCPRCSGLPPPFGCTCNPSNGAITCPHDAAADRPPGQ